MKINIELIVFDYYLFDFCDVYLFFISYVYVVVKVVFWNCFKFVLENGIVSGFLCSDFLIFVGLNIIIWSFLINLMVVFNLKLIVLFVNLFLFWCWWIIIVLIL